MTYVTVCGIPYDLDLDGHRHEESCPACFAAKHPSLGPDIDAILKRPAFKDFTPRNWIDLAIAAIDQAGDGEAWRAAVILERYKNEY